MMTEQQTWFAVAAFDHSHIVRVVMAVLTIEARPARDKTLGVFGVEKEGFNAKPQISWGL